MPNDDLISREMLLEALSGKLMVVVFPNWKDFDFDMRHNLHKLGDAFEREIEAVPAVDAKPVRHATWRKNISGEYVFCSACDDYSFGRGCFAFPNRPEVTNWRYCPICGAKMDLKEDV